MTNEDIPAISPELIKRRKFFDALKISSCLTSSWIVTAGSVFLSSNIWDSPNKILYSAAAVSLTGLAATAAGLVYTFNKFTSKNSLPPTAAEEKLNECSRDKISPAVGLKRPLIVHLRDDMGSRISAPLGNHLHMNKMIYDYLEPKERFSVVLHEFIHAKKKDIVAMFVGGVSKNISLASIPAAVIGSTQLIPQSLTNPFTAAAAVIVPAACTALYFGSKILSNTAHRVMENRADRDSIAISRDPMPTITTVMKLVAPKEKNTFQKLSSAHPTRDDRIESIKKDVREAWPNHAQALLGEKPPESPRMPRLPAALQIVVPKPQSA